jgi:ketosteroid isomerase-like protein
VAPLPDDPGAWVTHVYDAFNEGQIEVLLAAMAEDVHFATTLESGSVDGRDAVRRYWLRQFHHIRPTITPTEVEVIGDDQIVVVAHQVVRDPATKQTLAEQSVRQIYTFRDGQISDYQVG